MKVKKFKKYDRELELSQAEVKDPRVLQAIDTYFFKSFCFKISRISSIRKLFNSLSMREIFYSDFPNSWLTGLVGKIVNLLSVSSVRNYSVPNIYQFGHSTITFGGNSVKMISK